MKSCMWEVDLSNDFDRYLTLFYSSSNNCDIQYIIIEFLAILVTDVYNRRNVNKILFIVTYCSKC